MMEVDPILRTAILGCAGAGLCAWLLSVVTREYSWVDRAWSILPPLYVGYFAYASGGNPRLVLMASLAALWGARLTYNFARKGGYAKHGEDYRWIELRKRMHPALFQIFNVVFIAAIQNAIIFGFTLPAWMACQRPSAPLGVIDLSAATLFIVLLAGETIADQQQWVFYGERKKLRDRGEPVRQEFLTTGLFRYSRHPNFFCEQAIWWAFYLFSVAAGGGIVNFSIVGPLVLTGLFQGSTNFTEELTLAKYPSYADYQRRTSRLWPWPPG